MMLVSVAVDFPERRELRVFENRAAPAKEEKVTVKTGSP